MLLQGLVERSIQEGEELMGFVTDIKKAFESLPRDPIFEIAHHLGLPAKTLETLSGHNGEKVFGQRGSQ